MEKTNLKGTAWHAPHNDRQPYDEVHITTRPRWKESELSGDEWRISALVQFKYKGAVIWETTTRNVPTALQHAYTLFVWANEGGLKYSDDVNHGAKPEDRCDQEGCSEVATVKYLLKFRYSNDGTKKKSHVAEYRQFCDRHKMRGDCGLDDADNNYEELLP